MVKKIQISIDNMGSHGEGVGRLEGFTLFVDGALPGEEVEAEIYKKEKRYGKAHLLSIFKPSPHRVKPPCKVFDRCGGCQIMHLSYDEQLNIKRQKVVDAFSRIGKIEAEISPCVPSPSQLSYRNKIQIQVRDQKLGFFERSSNDLVEVEGCHIHCPLGEQIFAKVKEIFKKHNFKARNIIIKSAATSNEALVIIVANQDCQAIAREIIKIPNVKGVIQNINDRNDNVVLGDIFKTLEGEGSINEIICGLSFKVSPASFFQVNTRQAEQLYQKALELANLDGSETVLDAYCGVGTLSLIFARHVKNVIGVECVPDAIVDAKQNAVNNHIENAAFICANSEDYIQKINQVDLVILNPPRKGCDIGFLEGINQLKPGKLIYISCDPATLARDLALLAPFGYKITRVLPFDMFPQTSHVETLVSMELIDEDSNLSNNVSRNPSSL